MFTANWNNFIEAGEKNLGFGMMRLPVLSGMSTLMQMRDNLRTALEAEPLNEQEQAALWEAMRIYRESAPIPQSEIDTCRGLTYNGVPVTALLQAWSICQIQPNPGFSDDNNYPKNAFAELAHLDFRQGLPAQKAIKADGTDITGLVEKCVQWEREHSF